MITLTLTGNNWAEVQAQASVIFSLQQLQNEPTPTNFICDEPERRKFKVIITPYSDIAPGDIGTMMEEKGDGYALCFDQLFTSADKPADRTKQTRIVFFPKDHVEEIK